MHISLYIEIREVSYFEQMDGSWKKLDLFV